MKTTRMSPVASVELKLNLMGLNSPRLSAAASQLVPCGDTDGASHLEAAGWTAGRQEDMIVLTAALCRIKPTWNLLWRPGEPNVTIRVSSEVLTWSLMSTQLDLQSPRAS